MNARRLNKRLATLNQEQVAYINGCNVLQRAVWRITHEDPLFSIRGQIKKYILREAILILINIRDRINKAILKLTLHKWLKNAKAIEQNKEKLRALLKIIFLNKEAKDKNTLTKYFQRWAAKPVVNEAEILRKYGYIFKYLDNIAKDATLPAKRLFFKKLKRTINPEYYKKPLKNVVKTYGKNTLRVLTKVINKWRDNARNDEVNELKKMFLKKAIQNILRNRDKQDLLKAFRKWNRNILAERLMDRFDEEEYTKTTKRIIMVYDKSNRMNDFKRLTRALHRWRMNTIEKGEPLSQRILRAKKHMLKHNINKNGEDLVNSLKDVSEIKRIEDLLKKFVYRAKKYNLPLLRKTFRKWYDTANDLKNKELLKNIQLRYVTIIADRVRKDQDKDRLRTAFEKWRRNAQGPKTILPDTEKAIHLLRKATTQPFFQKLRDNILKDLNNEKFRALIAAYVRRGDKDLLHWWFGQWRKNALKLKIYELKALLLKHIYNAQERTEKLRTIIILKERLRNYRFKDVLKNVILRSLINKINRLNDELDKAKLTRALYIWRSKLQPKKDDHILDNFDEGAKILRRYCWRKTHRDSLDAFDYKITFPAQDKILKKLITHFDRKNNRDVLLKKFYKWRMKCVQPQEDQEEKIKRFFFKYIEQEPIRKKLFSLYKDIPIALRKARETKEDAARKIADYLRGIKEIPDQLRNLRISKFLMKIINRYIDNTYLTILSNLKEWQRRARVLKAHEDARIIQKFIREKLNRRLKTRERF